MADPGTFAEPGHPDAAGWALGILDPEESSRFEDHLASCPGCQQAVAEFGTVTQLLKTAADRPGLQLAEGPEPPPDLQTRTLGRIERAASKAAWRRWSPRQTLSAAGAAVVAAAAAITVILAQSGPALAFSIPLHAQHGSTASGQAAAHHTANGWSITLTVHRMPKLQPGQFFECWYAGPGNRPGHPELITAGTFTTHPDGSATVQMWSAADPRTFPVMQITTEAPGDAGQHGQVLLSGSAQT